MSSRAEPCKPHLVAGTGFQTSFPRQTVMPEAWEWGVADKVDKVLWGTWAGASLVLPPPSLEAGAG